jgi:hypothetical protein
MVEPRGGAQQPLCLSCYSRLEEIQFLNWLKAAAMMNQALDDMDAIVPIGGTSGRIPVAEIARAASQSRTYNNIHITGSTVGVINTGNLARIDAAITMSKGTEAEEFGARLKDLTDAILRENELDAELKQQMVEVLQAISDQAIGSKKPSKIVVGTLFGQLKQLAGDVTVIEVGVEKLRQAWDILQGML